MNILVELHLFRDHHFVVTVRFKRFAHLAFGPLGWQQLVLLNVVMKECLIDVRL